MENEKEILESIDKKLTVLLNQNINKQALDTMFSNLNKISITESRLRSAIARLDILVNTLGIEEMKVHLDEALLIAGVERDSDLDSLEYFEFISGGSEMEGAKPIILQPAYIFTTAEGVKNVIIFGRAEYPFAALSDPEKEESDIKEQVTKSQKFKNNLGRFFTKITTTIKGVNKKWIQ